MCGCVGVVCVNVCVCGVCMCAHIDTKLAVYVAMHTLLNHTVNSRTHFRIHATKGMLKPAPYHTAMKEQYFVANKVPYKTHVIWELRS